LASLYVVMAAMGYCLPNADPSKGIRRLTPLPRSQTWREGEAVRLVKHAVSNGSPGSGVPCRGGLGHSVLTRGRTWPSRRELVTDGRDLLFRNLSRKKTDAPAIGTLSRRTQRLVGEYVGLRSVPSFIHARCSSENRSGRPYSKDTLGDDFRRIRSAVFPGDERRLMDLRRSGASRPLREGRSQPLGGQDGQHHQPLAGAAAHVSASGLAAVKAADAARRAGRRRMRETG
jgi:hypothetical protein